MNHQDTLVPKSEIHHQRGVASLLFILLVGISLVIIVLGVFLSLRGLQDSAITSHAQTQSEEKTMIGVKALSSFLYSKTDTQLAAITGGAITDTNGTLTGTAGTSVATYTKSATCPTSSTTTQYCFDVTASSGGASSTIRSVYQRATIVGSSTLTGSVFAGGLIVGGSASLTGNNVSISVGAQTDSSGNVTVAAGNVTDTSGKVINSSLSGITVSAYTSATFITAADLKSYANYQFTTSGTTAVCTKLNVYNSSGSTCSALSTLGITHNTDGTWEITDPTLLPVGVLWFDNAVTIDLSSTAPLVNAIISTGSITATTSKAGTYYSYAPYYYYETNTTSLTVLERVCHGTTKLDIPTQYCNSDGSFNTSAIAGFPGSLANILFLTNNTLTLDAANTKATLDFYGNIIASYGAGGTGSASGKFTGTGNINITGNLVIAGSATTTMQGNITINLADSSATSSSVIPSVTYANGLRFIKYM